MRKYSKQIKEFKEKFNQTNTNVEEIIILREYKETGQKPPTTDQVNLEDIQIDDENKGNYKLYIKHKKTTVTVI